MVSCKPAPSMVSWTCCSGNGNCIFGPSLQILFPLVNYMWPPGEKQVASGNSFAAPGGGVPSGGGCGSLPPGTRSEVAHTERPECGVPLPELGRVQHPVSDLCIHPPQGQPFRVRHLVPRYPFERIPHLTPFGAEYFGQRSAPRSAVRLTQCRVG